MSLQKDHVQVLVRARPLLEREEEDEVVISPHDDGRSLLVNRGLHGVCTFSFDRMFTSAASQLDVYEEVRESIMSVLDGINCSVFAYGQTGTGKTYTMMGLEQDETEDRRGLIPHAVADLFKETSNCEDKEYKIYVSYLEIYNEKLFDLLNSQKKELQIHEEKKRGVFVQDAREVLVSSLDAVLSLMERGQRNRAVAATAMNELSSRSHSIFQLFVEQRNLETNNIRRGKLSLVDLAGSEKWDPGQHNYVAVQKEIKELSNINQSLSSLCNCVNALSQKGRKHIPYRDSKLTRLLKDSLGGNTRTTFIATISPSESASEETQQTLKFMERTKRIELSVKINEEVDQEELLRQYAREALLAREVVESTSNKQVEVLFGKMEEMDQESTALREALARSQAALMLEREERAKLTEVFRGAIVNIRNAPTPEKGKAAECSEIDLLRAENSYLKASIEQMQTVNYDQDARQQELDQYQEWLTTIPIRPPTGDEATCIEAAERMLLLEGTIHQAHKDLANTKRSLALFAEQLGNALKAKCEELETSQKKGAELQTEVDQLRLRVKDGENRMEAAKAEAVTRDQVLALLEKEATVRRMKGGAVALLGSLTRSVEDGLDMLARTRSYASLGTAKEEITRMLESMSAQLAQLEAERDHQLDGALAQSLSSLSTKFEDILSVRSHMSTSSGRSVSPRTASDTASQDSLQSRRDERKQPVNGASRGSARRQAGPGTFPARGTPGTGWSTPAVGRVSSREDRTPSLPLDHHTPGESEPAPRRGPEASACKKPGDRLALAAAALRAGGGLRELNDGGGEMFSPSKGTDPRTGPAKRRAPQSARGPRSRPPAVALPGTGAKRRPGTPSTRGRGR